MITYQGYEGQKEVVQKKAKNFVYRGRLLLGNRIIHLIVSV